MLPTLAETKPATQRPRLGSSSKKMLHHQRRANRVDGKDVLQVSGVEMAPAALGLALLAVQEAGGDDEQAQFQPGGRTLSGYPLRRSGKAGLI